jgi:hypothetical protein
MLCSRSRSRSQYPGKLKNTPVAAATNRLQGGYSGYSGYWLQEWLQGGYSTLDLFPVPTNRRGFY